MSDSDVRKQKGLNERMILVDEIYTSHKSQGQYKVCGRTSKVYDVIISVLPTCTCPDFCYRQQMCKHIYFVLYQVLRVPVDFDLSKKLKRPYVATWLRLRREQLLQHQQEEHKEEKAESGVDRKPIGEDPCPVCLEPMDQASEEVMFCAVTCGQNMHTVCMQRWSSHCKKWMCPLCRSDW